MVSLISEFVHPLAFQPTLLTVLVSAVVVQSSRSLNVSI